MSQIKSFGRFLSRVITVAALGFLYSSGTSAAIVLHGTDGGAISGDGKFAFSNTCVDTVTKVRSSTLCGSAPNIGYLYKGPISGKYYRTGTCWSRSLRASVPCSSATGFISSSFSPFRIEGGGIQGGDITVVLGDVDPNNQLISVEPGAVGDPTVVTIEMPDVLVRGYDTKGTDTTADDVLVGQARFGFKVVYTVPVATSDVTKSGGNDKACLKCDPDNPSKDCSGCQTNQTCTNLGGGESQFAVNIFCQQFVTVQGELKLLAGETAPTAFPGCTATVCNLKVGGLPKLNDCSTFFPPLTFGGSPPKQLAEKQLLSFQQKYLGTCESATLPDSGLESAVGTLLNLHRECHSDFFDGVDRGCVQEDADPKTAEGGEAARFIEVTTNLNPNSVNLRCDAGKDSGIAKVAICTTAEFNALDTDTGSPAELPFLIVQGDTACGGKPCRVPAIPGSATQADVCGDVSTDLQFSYLTCAADGKSGLAQAIRSARPNVQAGELVPVTLQGTASNGSVVIQGTDDAKVVNP